VTVACTIILAARTRSPARSLSTKRSSPKSSTRRAVDQRQRAVDAGEGGERAALCAMVARLMRQSNSSKPAPAGATAISVVLPPPFFHGAGRRLAYWN
jgi:hypothetical protein